MFDEEHYENLRQGALHWNVWAKNQGRGFRADLENANLQNIDLARIDLEKAQMRSVRLDDSDLTDALLFSAELSEANLNGTTLIRTHLSFANLENASLMLADLTDAKLFGANLTNSNFAATVLDNADLREAKLEGAMFNSAGMRGAQVSTTKPLSSHMGMGRPICDLRNVRGLTQEQVDTMSGDSGTLLPEHLKHPAHWPNVPEDVLPKRLGLGLFSTPPETDQPTAFTKPATTAHAGSKLLEKPANKIDISPLTPQQVAWMMGATGNTEVPDAPRKIASDPFVFLSYKREDRPWVQTLRDALIKAGIPIWWDNDIPFDQNWNDAISARLERAEIVLTVWTEKSIASSEVGIEALYASRNGKLVQIRKGQPKLAPRYAVLQCADLTEWSPQAAHEDFDRLVETLRRRLGA